MKIKKIAKSAVSLLLSAIMAVSMAAPVLAADTGSAQDVYYSYNAENDSNGVYTGTLHLSSSSTSGYTLVEIDTVNGPQWQDNFQEPLLEAINIIIDDEIYPDSTYMWFTNCNVPTTFENFNNINTKYTTDMGKMFYHSSAFENTSLNFSSWDMSAGFDATSMFEGASNITSVILPDGDNGKLKVTYAGSMFSECTNLTTIENLDKIDSSELVNTGAMFYDCTSLEKVDMSDIDLTNVMLNDNMFYGCESLSEISINMPESSGEYSWVEFPSSPSSVWYLANSCLFFNYDKIQSGNYTYYNTVQGKHQWTVVDYNWNDYNLTDGTGKVSADLYCDVCEGGKEVYSCTVEETTQEPTCGENGLITYTASITEMDLTDSSVTGTIVNDDESTKTQTSAINATGEHQWTATFDWNTFDSDNNTITANLVCSECGNTAIITGCTVSSKTVSPTCGEDGTLTYTASISDTNLNDNGISGTISSKEDTEKIEYLDATGDHSWNVTYDWNGYTSVSAALVCDVCGDTETVPASNCEITSRQTKTPTCTVQGEMTYTASVGSNVIDNLGGSIKQETNKTKTEALSTTDHTWTFDENDSDSYIISLSGGWMQFILTCSVCGETYTTERVALEFNQYDEYQGQSGITVCLATIKVGGKTYTFEKNINEVSAQAEQEMEQHDWVQSGDSTVATCTEDGKTYYYCATCSATKTIIEASKGHTWDVTNATWKWSNDLSSCSVTADCTTCGWHETTDCTITASSSSGSVIYTATATMSDGQVLRDTKLVDADAQGGNISNNQNTSNTSNSVSPAENTSSETDNTTTVDSTTTAMTELNASDGDATTNDTMTVQPTSTAFDNATENTAETTNAAKTGDTASIAGVATLCALTMLTAAAVTYRKRVRSDDESSSD